METNASTTAEAPKDTTFPSIDEPQRKIKWPYVIGGIIVILLGVAVASFLVNRSRSSANTQNPAETETQMAEYKNPNGFAFEYPRSLQLVPSEEGIRLNGETEITFMVKPVEEPLSQTVSEVAENFGIDPETPDFSTQTINSRTGYVLTYENKEYQYFPLFGDYYLEIVSDEDNEIASEVLSSLEFTPPQATLR